jgi:hypothetical protein
MGASQSKRGTCKNVSEGQSQNLPGAKNAREDSFDVIHTSDEIKRKSTKREKIEFQRRELETYRFPSPLAAESRLELYEFPASPNSRATSN